MSTPIQILNNAAEAVAWLRSRVQGDLHTDSRKVKAGDAFVAWPGAATDGRAYVGKAVEQGAAAVLVEAEGLRFEVLEMDKRRIALVDVRRIT